MPRVSPKVWECSNSKSVSVTSNEVDVSDVGYIDLIAVPMGFNLKFIVTWEINQDFFFFQAHINRLEANKIIYVQNTCMY